VAKRHGEISQLMFAQYSIDSITNGIHAATWASEPFRSLFGRYIPSWQHDNFSLRYALNIPKEEVWQAHVAAKQELIQFVNRTTNAGMDVHTLTLGFARRAATYKRANLLFENLDRLRALSKNCGTLQIVFAGKAHPSDHEGKLLIQRLFQYKQQLSPELKMVYLENYDMTLGKLLTSGVDAWLNTPEPPLEASGTSGMKAAINGVPSLSILDGWWIEGCIEGVTGWSIGEHGRHLNQSTDRTGDADALYDKLECAVIPTFYQERDRFIEIMRHAIALNGSFFNTQRMMQEYVVKAYFE
jgi:starch phosphorylase